MNKVILPPASGRPDAPLIVVWHMLDAPRTAEAMAAALPLSGVDAWRLYVDLDVPVEMTDPVLGFFGPIVDRAAAGFRTVLADARAEIAAAGQAGAETPAGAEVAAGQAAAGQAAAGPVRLVGASLSAMVALSLLAESGDLDIASVALVSPAVSMSGLVAVNEQMMGMSYPWSDESRAIAERFDFVARAGDLAKRGVPILQVIGQEDHEGFTGGAEKLWQALSNAGEPGRYSLITVPGMGHALAEGPGVRAAPQTAPAARVDSIVSEWFSRN